MTVIYKEESQLQSIPPRLRRKAGFRLGDQLEFKASPGAIMIVTKSVSRKSALLEALEATRADARKSGTDKLTMKQINAIIAKSRQERRARATKKPAQ